MKAYAIKDPNGKILPWHTTFYAKQTKDSFRSNHFYKNDWKYYYKRGYRCVPVEIREIVAEQLFDGCKPLDGEPLKALHEASKKSGKKITTLKNRR